MKTTLEINYTTKYGFTDGNNGYIICEKLEDTHNVYKSLREQINTQNWDNYDFVEFQCVKDNNVIIMLDDLVDKGFINDYEINIIIELV